MRKVLELFGMLWKPLRSTRLGNQIVSRASRRYVAKLTFREIVTSFQMEIAAYIGIPVGKAAWAGHPEHRADLFS